MCSFVQNHPIRLIFFLKKCSLKFILFYWSKDDFILRRIWRLPIKLKTVLFCHICVFVTFLPSLPVLVLGFPAKVSLLLCCFVCKCDFDVWSSMVQRNISSFLVLRFVEYINGFVAFRVFCSLVLFWTRGRLVLRLCFCSVVLKIISVAEQHV